MARTAFIVNIVGLSGSAESGGLVYSFVRNTSTPTPIYAGLSGGATLANPAVGDALGQITGYLDLDTIQYSLRAKTANQATTLWEADVTSAGLIVLTWVNPDLEVNPIIHVSWVPALAAPLGEGWANTLPLSVFGPVDPRRQPYGASTTASAADNQTAFMSIPAGSEVDCRGGIYAVTSLGAILQHIQPYNGTLVISGVSYPIPKRPLAHPFETSQPMVVSPADGTHPWIGPVGYYASANRWLRTLRIDDQHGAMLGSPIYVEESYDGGVRWIFRRVLIECADDEKIVGFSGGMIGTTFVIIALVTDGAGTYQRMEVKYTTDGGATFSSGSWTESNATDGSLFFPHSSIVIRESDGTPVLLGYAPGLWYAKANAAGTAWTTYRFDSLGDVGNVAVPAGEQITELEAVKLGDERYMLWMRNDNAPPTYTLLSDDLETWPNDPVESGLDTVTTPPKMLGPVWGKLWIIATARVGTEVIEGRRQQLLFFSYDPNDVWDSGGVFADPQPGPPAIDLPINAIGYLQHLQLPDGTYQGYLVAGESQLGSSASTESLIIRIGGWPAPVASPGIIKPWVEKSLFRNPAMHLWSRATSFAGATSFTKAMDGWGWTATTETMSVTQAELTAARRRLFPWRPHFAARLQSAAGGSSRALYQYFYGDIADIVPLLGKTVTIAVAGFGAIPGNCSATVTLYFGSGGSTALTATANSAQAALADSATMMYVTLAIPHDTTETWGTTPFLEFKWTFVTAGALDFYVTGMWLCYGDHFQMLAPREPEYDRLAQLPYLERIDFPAGSQIGEANVTTTSAAVGTLIFARKYRTPAISIVSGDAGDWEVAGVAPATTVFGDIGLQRAEIAYGSSSAFTADEWAVVKAADATAALIDAEVV